MSIQSANRDLNRRDFVGRLGGILGGLAAPAFIRSTQAANDVRPNILFIISDEHDPGVTGCYGDGIVQTPNLDRFAEQGVLFDNCYTNSPLCVPSRLSFLSGKYCTRVGVYSNNCWLPSDDYPTVSKLLKSSGYDCLLSGKLHFDSTRRYGFKELFPAFTNAYNKTGRGSRRKPDDTSINRKSWENRSSDFRVGDTSKVMEHDLKVTQACSEFLAKRRKDDRPFFMVAGYLSPHFPLVVPQEYYARYQDKIPMPNLPDGFLENQVLNYKHLRRGFGVTEATEEKTKLGRECYWAFTNWFDTQIGELLTALENSSVSDTTLVIYTTDHGENKGDHGMWWKNCMYEHASRVPLLVRWPGRWDDGSRRDGVCSLVDVTQTMLEAGGTEAPEDWNGQTLSGCLDDPDSPGPGFAVSEYYAHNIASGFAMLRLGDYKYVYHTRMTDEYGPEQELYNLIEDPGEFRNLANSPEHKERIKAMHKELLNELGRDPDETEQICRADYKKGYDRG